MSEQNTNTPDYLYAVIFAPIALFIVWLLYKLTTPVLGNVLSPLTSQYPSMVGNNPTFVSGFTSLVSNSTILYNYAFAIMGLGIVSVFIIIFSYRKTFGSTVVEEEY